MFFQLLAFFSCIFFVGSYTWVRVDEHCIRPYRYAKPVLCYPNLLFPENTEIELHPVFSTQMPSSAPQQTISTTFYTSTTLTSTFQTTSLPTIALPTLSTTSSRPVTSPTTFRPSLAPFTTTMPTLHQTTLMTKSTSYHHTYSNLPPPRSVLYGLFFIITFYTTFL
jgi:hypothetical protein